MFWTGIIWQIVWLEKLVYVPGRSWQTTSAMIQNFFILYFFMPSILVMSLFGLIMVSSERLFALILHSMKKVHEFSLRRMKFLWLIRWIFFWAVWKFFTEHYLLASPLASNTSSEPVLSVCVCIQQKDAWLAIQSNCCTNSCWLSIFWDHRNSLLHVQF